jgi:uncharacterized membrane protein YoaK (UPF0700 family)
MLLGGVASVVEPLQGLAPFIIASATGAINGTFTRRGEVTVGLTYMTGTLVKMGQSLASAFALRSIVYLSRFIQYTLLWAAIAIGALLGSLAYVALGLPAVWLSVVAMTVLAIMLTWRVKKRTDRVQD